MTFFIAEICSNHKNSLKRSKKLIDKCKKWSNDYNNINIIHSKWERVICSDKLKKYDEIFFDDFPNNIKNLDKFQMYNINNRIHLFLEMISQYHLNPGAKISAYICKDESLFSDPIWKSKYINNSKWQYNEKIMDISTSNIQKYHKFNNKAIIPLLTYLG